MADEPRGVTKGDLDFIDKCIASHEACQGQLYQFRVILGQVGKIDARRVDLNLGTENEQARLAEAHRQANAAQADLAKLQREIEAKQRELAEVEKVIAERRIACDELNNAINHLRAMLAAA
jgi:peptidoglycan hydrolase CwlO-like protein